MGTQEVYYCKGNMITRSKTYQLLKLGPVMGDDTSLERELGSE